MNEVYAHAVVGKHQHVVRYYSAWAENDHMYIQDEYCNGMCSPRVKSSLNYNNISKIWLVFIAHIYLCFAGGSLAEKVGRNQRQGLRLSELDLRQILLQISKGLLYIHSQNLVHLDIKPGKDKVMSVGDVLTRLVLSNPPF